MDFYSVIMDFFWVSVILFVAKIIREHVKILQNFFIPVSLIAGFIAWVVGPYGLKIVPLTSLCGDYAGALITVLFATIGSRDWGSKRAKGKNGPRILPVTVSIARSTGLYSFPFP